MKHLAAILLVLMLAAPLLAGDPPQAPEPPQAPPLRPSVVTAHAGYAWQWDYDLEKWLPLPVPGRLWQWDAGRGTWWLCSPAPQAQPQPVFQPTYQPAGRSGGC